MKLTLALVFIFSSAYGKDWWEHGNFYQIYPRSFKDSDGDGIGDIKGVTEKLPYLKEIGMTAAWLSPIFKSPMSDFGYDISDYYKIQPEYGTMEDLEELIEKAREIGLKIILDFVPNHTSDEHEWFQKSVRREGNFTNYYIWHDGRPDPKNRGGRNLPPNNWNSEFRYSAWQWNDERQQYYYHQFGVPQPDLNYRDPNVIEEMKNILKFWLGKGIGGFRIDAVPYLFEIDADANGNYPDEPVNPDCDDPNDYCSTIHIYMKDQPETFGVIYDWRKLVDDYTKEHGGDSRILMTEAYTTLDNTIKFYGDGVHNGSNIPFNFELITNLNMNSSAIDYAKVIDSWLDRMPQGVNPNWVLGNHDQKRVSSRFGEDRIDLINIFLQTLPGIAITFNGEEIGMTDVFISWEDTVDPQACSTNPKIFNSYSRDPARTPFQWDDSPNAGFSNASKTWLPVSQNYKETNVKLERTIQNSHLNIFKNLTQLRRQPTFQDGSYEHKTVGKDVLVYKRELSGSGTYFVVLNLGHENETVDVKSAFPAVGDRAEVVVTSIQSSLKIGDAIKTESIPAPQGVGTVFKSLK